MAAPRPVRIVRVPARTAPQTDARPGRDDRGEFRRNPGGTGRGLRLFAGYLALVAVIYLVFAALALTSPSPGARDDPVTWALFTATALLLLVPGWLLTIGRAPRGAWVGAGHLVVEERGGRIRRFSPGSGDRLVVLQRHGEGILSPRPTQLVEVSGTGGKRSYLIEAGLFEGAESRPEP